MIGAMEGADGQSREQIIKAKDQCANEEVFKMVITWR